MTKDDKTTSLTPRTMKILLVDDDAEIVETIRLALESAGYDVLVGTDGNQGLALAEKENPDLIILDMMMPRRSGFLMLETLRLSKRLPPRIMMITANEGTRHQEYAESLGVDAYLRKPFTIDVLLETAQQLLTADH